MKKLSVPELVEFRRKNDKTKRAFIEKIKSNKINAPTEGGGDYWIPGISAVCNAYKENDLNLIERKMDILKEKINNTRHTIAKNMYQRNIDILQAYKGMDLQRIRPAGSLSALKKSTSDSLLTLKGLQIQTKPSFVYIFGKQEEKVGAIWFIAKKNGYQREELGMFCDLLYRFLKRNYAGKFKLAPTYCIAVDMSGGIILDYSEMGGSGVKPVLNTTLEEINKLM